MDSDHYEHIHREMDVKRSVFHRAFRDHHAVELDDENTGRDKLDKKAEEVDVMRVVLSKEWISLLSTIGISHSLVTAVIAYLSGRITVLRDSKFKMTETDAALDFLEVNKEKIIYELMVYGVCVIAHSKSSAMLDSSKRRGFRSRKKMREDKSGTQKSSSDPQKSGLYPEGTGSVSSSQVHASDFTSSVVPGKIEFIRPSESSGKRAREEESDGENGAADDDDDEEDLLVVKREPNLVPVRLLLEANYSIHAIRSRFSGVPESYCVVDPKVGVMPDFTVITAAHAPLHSHKLLDASSLTFNGTYNDASISSQITKILLFPPASADMVSDFDIQSTSKNSTKMPIDVRIGYIRSPLTRALPLINELYMLKVKRWQSYENTKISRVLISEEDPVKKQTHLFTTLANSTARADDEEALELNQRAVDGNVAMLRQFMEQHAEQSGPIPTGMEDIMVSWNEEGTLPAPTMKNVPPGMKPTLVPPTAVINTETEEKDLIAQIGAALGLHSTVFIPYSAHYAGSNLSDDTHATNASLEMMRNGIVRVVSAVAAIHFAERNQEIFTEKFNIAFSLDRLGIMEALAYKNGSHYPTTRYMGRGRDVPIRGAFDTRYSKSEVELVSLNAASASSAAIFDMSLNFVKDIRDSMKIGAPMPLLEALLNADPAWSQNLAKQIGFEKPDIPKGADTPAFPAPPPPKPPAKK